MLERPPPKFPAPARWGVLAFLALWFPLYWRTWGLANFLHLCDIAVILTCIGLWRSNALLLSSQAVSSLAVDLAWGADAAWRWLRGLHLMGGTEYLFDVRFPLGVRLLSLFHAVLPFLLLAALRRTGYDRRALGLQSLIAAGAIMVARFTDATENTNFAFRDPFLHRPWGPVPVHLALTIGVLIAAVYWPTHTLLKRLYIAPHELSSQSYQGRNA